MNNKGFTLLLAVITTSIMLIISFVVTNVAFKQLLLSHSMRESQYAFYAADAGTECAVYWDLKNTTSAFSTSTGGSITCSGMTIDNVVNAQTMPTYPVASMIGGGGSANPTSTFTLTFPTGCAIVRVGKHPDGTTLIDSRGYNSCNTSAAKRYERGVTLRFDNGSYLGGNGNVPTSPTLTTDVSSVASGSSLNVSWTNISSIPGNPKSTDWIALYPSSATTDTGYVANSGIFAGSCSSTSATPGSSGTCGFSIPNGTAVGSYYLMMFDQVPTTGGSQVAIAATSNINVTAALIGHISLTPASLTFSATTNATPAAKTVALQNTGTGTLSWTATPNQTWCHVSATSGSLASGASATLTVTVDARSTVGAYNCSITVSSTSADNSPQTIAVTFNVTSAYTCATPSGNYQDLSSGNYKIYKFTSGSSNSLNVTCAGPVDYLVVGGGGGGGGGNGGGMGGGGGARVRYGSFTLSTGSYTIVVGGGGAGSGGGTGANGSPSSFNGSVSEGGGGGAGEDQNAPSSSAFGGGGGGGAWSAGGASLGGTGVASRGGDGDTNSGGGGGGAGGNGSNGSWSGYGGNGGTGLSTTTSNTTNTNVCYGGGGAGSGYNGGGTGTCGGGAGATFGANGVSGTANTGGGGGAGRFGTGGTGGSGVVIIKFKFQ